MDSIHLNNSISRYLKFAKELDSEKFVVHGFPVGPKGVDSIFKYTLENLAYIVSQLQGKASIHLYSLQNSYLDPKPEKEPPRNYWNTETKKVLFNNTSREKEPARIYLFLFDSGARAISASHSFFKYKNSTDSEFCHSMLFRDFVKNKKIGFEIDLSIDNKNQNNEQYSSEFIRELNRKIAYLESKSEISSKCILGKSNFAKFNKYFPDAKLKKDDYVKIITDYYSYGINKEAFRDLNEITLIHEISSNDVDFGHDAFGSVVTQLNKTANKDLDIAKLTKWLIYSDILSNLTKMIVDYDPDANVNLLLIDDKPEKLEKEIEFLRSFFKTGKIIIDNNKNDKVTKERFDLFFNSLKNNVNEELKEEEKKVRDKIIGEIDKRYDFIIMDLDYDGQLKGFDYLKTLRESKEIYEKPYVIVFSRNEDSESIQKALSMGALIYATKQNVAYLAKEIFKILPTIRKLDKLKNENLIGDNWNLLYQLPLSKILSLMSSLIGDQNSSDFYMKDSGFNDNILKKQNDYHWVKKLPKAELHNHIGSILGPELIPQTALVVLSKWYNKCESGKKQKILKDILSFLLPLITDPFFLDSDNPSLKFVDCIIDKDKYSDWFKLKRCFAIDEENQFYDHCIFTIISESLNLAGLNKTPEEVLLSPTDDTIEKHFKPLSKIINSEYYKQKLKLREEKVDYEIVMLCFILLLELRQRSSNEYKEKLEDISKKVKNVFNLGKENYSKLESPPNANRTQSEDNSKESKQKSKQNEKKNPIPIYPSTEIEGFIKDFSAILNSYGKIFNEYEKNDQLIQFLISAHSQKRCIPFSGRGLFNYLRGCEYGGAPHLQCEESLFLVSHHIVVNYAVPDNIRYLDIRCSVDGYNKLGLFETDKNNSIEIYLEIVKYLKQYFDFWQRIQLEINKKVHINLIITAKRHKPLKEFEQNVEIVLKDRENEKSTVQKYKEPYFENAKCRIVSFDIAGLEKGYRVNRFKDQIKPLLDSCIPITMHAGEEDGDEAIWEAVYLAYAQRLGHALSLKDNSALQTLVREAQVNVELCPISNYLTNNKFQFEENKTISKYPLKDYLKDRISVSINTDNPYVSDTTLTKEFLFAAMISGGLTRWQILKLILYSFKSITVDKQLKSQLLKEIDEEIFGLILEEE